MEFRRNQHPGVRENLSGIGNCQAQKPSSREVLAARQSGGGRRLRLTRRGRRARLRGKGKLKTEILAPCVAGVVSSRKVTPGTNSGAQAPENLSSRETP